MTRSPKRWIYKVKPGWKKRARAAHGNLCQMCGSDQNTRGNVRVAGVKLDIAHLVAKVELESVGEAIGRPFLTDVANLAVLCQMCHSEFDDFLGFTEIGRRRSEFPLVARYYRQVDGLIRRRKVILRTLRSLASIEDAVGN